MAEKPRVERGATKPLEPRRRGPLRSVFGAETALRTAEAALGALLFLVLIQGALGFTLLDPVFWNRFQRSLWRGFQGTLYYSAIVVPASVVIGFFAGWARVSRYRSLSWPVSVYVDLIRGIPPIVLVIFAFLFVPALLPDQFNTQEAALLFSAIALAVHSGSYQAEIFRAGFQSVPRGQLEAAQAIGLDNWTIMGSVVLPQAFRLSLPPLGNELASLVKDTSLLGALGAVELVALGQEFNQQLVIFGGQLGWVFAVWTAVAALYFVLTFAVTRGLLFIEKRFRVPGMEGVSV